MIKRDLTLFLPHGACSTRNLGGIFMIEGVMVQKLMLIPDERGWLMEILRNDWGVLQKFGRAYVSAAYSNVVKAWHMHKKQIDCLVCVKGMVKLVLYDGRKSSKTKGEINEFFLGESNPILVKVPARVWHGYKAINETAFIINICTELYNEKKPDEYRLPPNTKKIPYNWSLLPS